MKSNEIKTQFILFIFFIEGCFTTRHSSCIVASHLFVSLDFNPSYKFTWSQKNAILAWSLPHWDRIWLLPPFLSGCPSFLGYFSSYGCGLHGAHTSECTISKGLLVCLPLIWKRSPIWYLPSMHVLQNNEDMGVSPIPCPHSNLNQNYLSKSKFAFGCDSLRDG